MKPWKLQEMKYSDIKGQTFEVALQPLGATEPHNLHLPYGTDTITVEHIADTVCGHAHSQGAKVIQLPTIPYGVDSNLMEFPLTMSLQPSTLDIVLTDIVESLETHGIRKLIFLNGHGGNSLKHLLRELYGKTSVFISLLDWYSMVKDVYGDIFDSPEDHAGEMETALGLHWFPELIDLSRADDGAVRTLRLEALRKGWAQITRPWELLTKNAGSGDPRNATAEKGERLLEILKDRIGTYIVELSQTELDEDFPFDRRSR